MLLPLVVLFGCEPPSPAPQTAALVPAQPAPAPTPALGHGGVVYVPVYSSIYVGEGDQTFDLTVTLSVRNTDRDTPITISAVDYHATSGALLHRYVESPTELAPLSSADTVVRESDTRAGVGGSFLVTWSAAEDVTDPVIEAIMIGSAHQQGMSFVSQGRVVERTVGPAAAP